MTLRFTSPLEHKPGIIANLLKESYAELVSSDFETWGPEQQNWGQFDQDVFAFPDTIGECVFLSWSGDQLVGFGSYDPRQKPELGIIGHNCVLPEFRRNGFGKQQIVEILRRFEAIGIQKAKVSTNDHPFFKPAQRMYISCGFKETMRVPWNRNPNLRLIEYEKKIG